MDLQAKIILVLIGVIVPTFLVGTYAENKLAKPILEDDIRLVGINAAKTLASEIASSRLLYRQDATQLIETRIQEIVYAQPSVYRMDVAAHDPITGQMRNIASNVEDEPGSVTPPLPLVENITSDYKVDENSEAYWEVSVPIELKSRDARGPRRLIGVVRAQVSLKMVENFVATLWRTTVTVAMFIVVTLIFALTYFLRKTINNDRKLRIVETKNIALTEQLHETQRDLMNTEKLAVMGQLTASFAHEIGTPLNAIGGHLQLLGEEIGENSRLEIVNGQLAKIEEIVKGFLQSTAKPSSQRQLVDANQMIDKTLTVLRPRIEAAGVSVKRNLDRSLGPVRVVPVELEQIFLNLLNNSLDSLKAKKTAAPESEALLEVESSRVKETDKEWAQISIYDTGEGIKKVDMAKVLKPFFTTKPPGEGTGLGLTICKELVQKYGGSLALDSKEGAWTRVTVRVPFSGGSA
jgi:signal transduction histidine kinase